MKPLEQNLINSGYKIYKSELTYLLKHTDTLFQKSIRDNVGIRYFINLYYYPKGDNIDENIQAEVQFYDSDDNVLMNVDLFSRNIDEIELQFNNIWDKLHIGYYERY